jgi:hypothetical protein
MTMYDCAIYAYENVDTIQEVTMVILQKLPGLWRFDSLVFE